MKGLMQSELFDVSAIEAINKEIKEAEHIKENLAARRALILPYYQDPKNDNEKMFNYQYEYLKNNDEDAWGKMIELAFKITKRLVWQWMKKNKVRLDSIEQDEKTSVAVEYVLRRYKKNVGYCVYKNFITALNEGVKHAMLYCTKLDQNTTSWEEVFFVEEKDYEE